MHEELIHQAVNHAHAQHGAYLEHFLEFLRIPSISAESAYQAEVRRAAEWIVAELERLEFKHCQLLPTDRHPVVYGEWLRAGDDAPTMLVYAHYDTQPVDPLDLWETPPFEPEIRDGKIYARGVIDDKCGVYLHLKAIESILATAGALPLNVKVFFEGSEESASPGMDTLIRTQKALLAADFLLVSDGGSPPDSPHNSYATRGLVAAEITVNGPQYDVHSGALGGAVQNPIHLLSTIIASFHDARGHILVPGFYDDVVGLTDEERQAFSQTEADRIAKMKTIMGDFRLWGEPDYTFVERTTARPTLDVNGVYGGYQGEDSKTIIPATAGCKVTMRLAHAQNPHAIAQRFTEHVMSFACDTADIEVAITSTDWPARLMRESPQIDALNRAYTAVWGTPATLERTGGSIPVLGLFQQELQIPMTMLGFGTGGNGHAPNEYMLLDYFDKGIDTAIHFYYYVAEK